MDFVKWLRAEIEERGWSQNELGRRAGVSSGGISLILSRQRRPSPGVCRGIARVLEIPEETVFRKAGILEGADDFAAWLAEEMETRDLGVRALARRAGTSPSSISNVLNRKRSAGTELCQALATGLGLPEEVVFQRAGLLRPSYQIRLFGRLTPAQRNVIVRQMQEMIARNERETGG